MDTYQYTESRLKNLILEAKIAGGREVFEPMLAALSDLDEDSVVTVRGITEIILTARDGYELTCRRKMKA